MNNAATFRNRHAILVISVVISLRKTRTVEPWETCEWRRHRSRYWYVVLSLLKIRFDVFRLRSGRVVNNVHTALAPADFCFLAEIRWKVSRGMKRRWNEWFTFRFGWRTCHRRYHLPRVISTIFIPTPFLHPPLFFSRWYEIFPSFYLYYWMHKYSRRIFRSNETYEKCKILSTRSLDQFFSLTRYTRVCT